MPKGRHHIYNSHLKSSTSLGLVFHAVMAASLVLKIPLCIAHLLHSSFQKLSIVIGVASLPQNGHALSVMSGLLIFFFALPTLGLLCKLRDKQMRRAGLDLNLWSQSSVTFCSVLACLVKRTPATVSVAHHDFTS